MEEIPTFVPVVAALIRDGEGRILLQQALPGKRHAGLWELPGGKVDRGETPRGALVREIDEELGITLEAEALLPAGFTDDGLPVGLQIVGRYKDDVGVLQLAYAFEQATRIGERRPIALT